jgi:hypothetical protein
MHIRYMRTLEELGLARTLVTGEYPTLMLGHQGIAKFSESSVKENEILLAAII